MMRRSQHGCYPELCEVFLRKASSDDLLANHGECDAASAPPNKTPAVSKLHIREVSRR